MVLPGATVSSQKTQKEVPLWPLYPPSPPRRWATSSLFFDQHGLWQGDDEVVRKATLAYTCGLIQLEKPTLEGIAIRYQIPKEELRLALELIDAQGVYDASLADLEPGGQVQVDNVVVAKENTTATDFAFQVYSSGDKRVLKGNDFVSLLYVAPSGRQTLLALLLWRKDDKTKIEMAQEALARMLKKGLKVKRVAFDHGYLEPEFCKWLHKKQVIWTSRVQKTQLFYFGNEWLSCREWAKKQGMETWHYYGKAGVYSKGIEASNPEYYRVKIVAVKWSRSADLETYCYYITNDRAASVMDVLRRYKQRWTVEVCHRDGKQSLGLNSYRYRDVAKIEGHVALVIVAFNFLQWIGQGSELPVGQLARMARGQTAKPRRTRISSTRLTKVAA